MNKELLALAFLLIYPRRQLIDRLDDIRTCLLSSAHFTKPVKENLKRFFCGLHDAPLRQLQSMYVLSFDAPAGAALNLSRYRSEEGVESGAPLSRLAELYTSHGQTFDREDVPDFLPAVLEFLSAVPENEAQSWLQSAAPLLESVRSGLKQQDSPWLAVADALLNFGAFRTGSIPGLSPSKG
jgi:nitrate reductase delta subunit